MEEDLTVQNKIFGKTFLWMFLGLLISAGTAWYTYSSGLFINLLLSNTYMFILIAELVAVLIFNFLFKRLPPILVAFLYILYSILNGVSLFTVFALFELGSVTYLFIVSALIFAVLGLIGYYTKKDLSSWSTYITVFLIAGIILSLLNVFVIKSGTFDLILDWGILILFFGITVYDVKKIKDFSQNPEMNQSKIYIYCAMQLYLDFINIFLRVLSIFGKRRD